MLMLRCSCSDVAPDATRAAAERWLENSHPGYEPSERLNGEIKRLTELPMESAIVRITAPSCSNSIWPATVRAT